MSKEKFYITTPIYYPSNKLTLGNSYTTVFCDALARFNKYLNKDVFFLTGTDEHGEKIEKIAKEKNMKEIDFLDEIVSDAKKLWKSLDVEYDKFIRTTEATHIKIVENIFNKLYEKGYIYKSEYSDYYCTPCESFWTASQLIDNCCPDCGRNVAKQSEEAYFFKLSSFSDKLTDLLKNNKNFLKPEHRVNEMIKNFLEPGLQDLCISRTTVKWGVQVPFDKKHTIYVWLDALLNYITALGYGTEDESKFRKYWPADVQVVGKEITRFHAIIWPAILMALEIPLPKTIYSHGWILFGEGKLSKSKAVETKEWLDPRMISDKLGTDAVRYLLLKQLSYGMDNEYSTREFLTRYNSDLVNNYGNLISRSFTMLNKYFDGIIPNVDKFTQTDFEHKEKISQFKQNTIKFMNNFDTAKALSETFLIFDACNKYIDEEKPWQLSKDNEKRLATVMNVLFCSIIEGTSILRPFLPSTADKVLFALNINKKPTILDSAKNLISKRKIQKLNILFPRVDIEKELS